MNVLIYLVPMALGLGLIGLFAFLWALSSGQYSDVDGAALRVLSDDDIEEYSHGVMTGQRHRVEFRRQHDLQHFAIVGIAEHGVLDLRRLDPARAGRETCARLGLRTRF